MLRINWKGGWRHLLLAGAIVFLAGGVSVIFAGEGPDEPKTAEQAYKNIQVLKGMPESQVIGAMGYMEAALGAKDCAYCHVRSGEREMAWDKDDNPKKQTSRKMIQMVLDINKANFNGRPEVTCYTCHQGHEHPVGTPSLPLVPAEAEAPKPRPAGGFPPPAEIVDKYMQAVGGKEAAAKLGALVLKGTQTGQNGAGMQVEVYWKAPDKIFSEVTTPGGVFAQGFDGSAGWTQSRNGTREMNPSELARIKDMESMYSPVKLVDPLPRMRVAGKEMIGTRETWMLLALGQDRRLERLFFDTETGLLLRKIIVTPTMIGTIPEQIDFEDYRETGGVKLPFTVRLTILNPRGSWDQKFETIKSDLPIEDSKFAKPASAETKPIAER